MKTNLNYLTSLSKSHSILIVQEHWLYAFESSIVQQIYNNSNYHIKCVDDLDPIPPIQPPRGHAGTCILWKKEINHYVNILPDGGHRITAIEFKGDDGLVCLINVYMPARGSPDCDMQFQSTLDEIHEILAAGSPTSPDNPLVKNRKDARRLMRKTIRQQVYADNQDKYQEIMDANERDTKTFYKLVNQQRTVKSTSTEILYFDGKTCSSVNEVAAAFSEHFERLATPSDNPDYDADYKAQVEFDTLLIEMITQQQTCCIKPVSPKEISNIINSFKTNKAQDIFGLSSEHLKYAPDCLYHILSSLMNCILRSGYVSF